MSRIYLRDIGLKQEDMELLLAEDKRQIEKWGYQEHSAPEWVTIIAEEFGELAHAISEYMHREGKLSDIEKEAVQVATLSLKIAVIIREAMSRDFRKGS